jgi:threonine dehydrogenase-like Zn-dependent dehydrogenase
MQALGNNLVDVAPLITHSIKLDDLVQGIADVKNRADDVMKAVVTI